MSIEDDASPPALELALLGPMEVRREGELVELPQSRKTRALLGYLAVTARRHRRETLCSLLWDVTDDRRGGLRWSLSKLRRVILADRDSVALDVEALGIDLRVFQKIAADPSAASIEQLERAASLSRGEFLEGLDLPDFHDFHAWCVAIREEVREQRGAVLGAVAKRLEGQPERALPHLRAWVRFDPFSIEARVALLEVLVALDKSEEAKQTFELGCRVLRELEPESMPMLKARWRTVSTRRAAPREPVAPSPVSVAAVEAPARPPSPRPERPFVGREEELGALVGLLEQVQARANLRVALVTGEPGAGKSRLTELVLEAAQQRGMKIFRGRAFDADVRRPFGPWSDALSSNPEVGLPDVLDTTREEQPASREVVFGAVGQTLIESTRPRGALLALDDVQWLDADSAELLQSIVRMSVQRPLFVLLGARPGELADNEAMLRALRNIRRETRVDEIALQPLGIDDLRVWIATLGLQADPVKLAEASAGNPLYVSELLQAGADAGEGPPPRLVDLVRDRLDRLPADAGELLRWASVLGHEFDVSRVEELGSFSLEGMVDALELLERHGLVAALPTKGRMRYRFSHDVVREAIYSELSHPRRCLMHRRIAQLLEPRMDDPGVATEVARHAVLSRDAALGVAACIRAARQSLRVFACAEAQTLARRGLNLVDDLGEADAVAAEIELLQVAWSAREPERSSAAKRMRALTDRALALGLTRAARLGFHVLAHLEWEQGSMAQAHRHMMEAERVSRTSDPTERATALAEAARCLVLLERNLEQAQAFVYEVRAVAQGNDGVPMHAVAFTEGVLRAHRGEVDEAIEALSEARGLAVGAGDRLAEFQALERIVMLEIDAGNLEEASRHTGELQALGERVREGSEAAGARALRALCDWLGDGSSGSASALEAATDELERLDAKQRLCFVDGRWARALVKRGELERARRVAGRWMASAEALEHSEEAARAAEVLEG